jgi:hypothetical protein
MFINIPNGKEIFRARMPGGSYESNNLRAVNLFKTKDDYDKFVNQLEEEMKTLPYFKGPFFQNGWVTGEYDDIEKERKNKMRTTRKRKRYN